MMQVREGDHIFLRNEIAQQPGIAVSFAVEYELFGEEPFWGQIGPSWAQKSQKIAKKRAGF